MFIRCPVFKRVPDLIWKYKAKCVYGAADRRKRFATPGMPLIGAPKCADERAGTNQIPNFRILHGRRGRWGR